MARIISECDKSAGRATRNSTKNSATFGQRSAASGALVHAKYDPQREALTFLLAVAAVALLVVVVADDVVDGAVAVDAALVAAVRVDAAADVEVAGFGFLSATATAGTVSAALLSLLSPQPCADGVGLAAS